MEISFKTDKGIRRNNNEDACFVMEEYNIFIVADGVGGNNSGEIASKTAVNEIVSYIKDHPLKKIKSDEKINAYFDECIKSANFKVLEISQQTDENKGMATTAVIAYVKKNRLYIINVGDSRGYIFRRNVLSQITEDHTYVNTLLKAGLISEEEAENHENRNMITRAIGAEINIKPDFFNVEVKAGDIVLICTDGLYGEVGEYQMTEELSKRESVDDICNELISIANRNGGSDNITLVCLKIMEEDVK